MEEVLLFFSYMDEKPDKSLNFEFIDKAKMSLKIRKYVA